MGVFEEYFNNVSHPTGSKISNGMF